jgi:ankyrin repeat protein
MGAACKGHTTAVNLLLEKGAVHCVGIMKNWTRKSALELAINLGLTEMVEYLQKHISRMEN